MDSWNAAQAMRFSDRSLVDAVIESYFIVDYGFVDNVNDDDTVDVVHAVKQQTASGESLPETKTQKVEVLTLSCKEWSVSFKPNKGDKVLLLALKDYVKATEDVSTAEESKCYLHYDRETMKALPLAAFSDDSKIRLKMDGGTLTAECDEDFNVESQNGSFKCDKDFSVDSDNAKFKAGSEFNVESDTAKIKSDGDTTIDAKNVDVKASAKIKLNGESKQFVTWTELNTALQTLVTQINSHVHQVPEPVAAPCKPISSPLTIDISAAKTTTVVTGG